MPRVILPAPSAPVLSKNGSQTIQIATTVSDVGGYFITQESKDGGSTWPQEYSHAWQTEHIEPYATWNTPCHLRTLERGNGSNYLGDSPWSNVLAVP